MEEEKKQFDKYAYDQQYIKNYVQLVQISFNRTKQDDMEMIAWLNSRPEGKTRYMKSLIAKDMKQKGK